ncbi:hypothetical protein L226DRAFT_576870 [Lentinus tigrinus ALCF2SS1-7]|uniref:uncharacterized protein n=1 Tax=Lentinus tigrinus ALCF2SS1-7 TaxID=1328758 RepID=UPI0011661311|nr:hypothetical protein L226DRAFT_576870 [Lentinus tigrinus ALCF2SS1-7]
MPSTSTSRTGPSSASLHSSGPRTQKKKSHARGNKQSQTQEDGSRVDVDAIPTVKPGHPTDLQRLVLTRPNHFLPWRELAPSRQHVTGPGGLFHPDMVDKPGAFPSMLIFRGLFFESPKILQKATTCYYPSQQHWDAFVASQPEGIPTTETQQDKYFNIRCYGQPSYQRREGMKVVPKLCTGGFRANVVLECNLGKRKRGQKLVKCPLFGPLTAYLFATNLSYMGKVAKPTTTEVAEMVRIIQRGSWKALLALGQITDDASAEETGVALKRVYDAVWDGLRTDKAQMHVRYDPIVLAML